MEQHEPQRIHTVHHHHVLKQTIIKKVNVPVIKEVKVPFYIYEFVKVPYAYHVAPYIVKVPIEYYPEEKHEHIHEPEPKKEEKKEEEDHHEAEAEHESESHHSEESKGSDGHLHHLEQFESFEESKENDHDHHSNESH